MNPKKILIPLACLGLILPAFADETGKPHSHDHEHAHDGHHATILVPEDPTELWAHINAYSKVVANSAANGNVDTLHKEQINLEALIGELDHCLSVVGEKKLSRVEGMIKNTKRALGQLHTATDSNDAKGMKKSAKSLSGVIALLKAQYPKEITAGTTEVKDDLGPHEGMLADLLDSSGKAIAFIELKLHDDKGDLELWLAKDNAISQPFDIAATEKITVAFTSAKEKTATLAARNMEKNEDEDGKANMRDGKTNYFIFPGNSGVSAKWLMGTKFKSDVKVSFSSAGSNYSTGTFMLIPHGHHGHSHDH